MTEPTTLAQLQQSATLAPRNDVTMSLTTSAGFDQLQRVAKALSASTMVPVQYRAFAEVKEYGKVVAYEANAAGLPNCIVALNMAQRMGADPLMIMQSLHVIEGRPSWSSQFIISAINGCGRFSPLRFEISEPGEPVEVTYTATVWKNKQKTEEQRKVAVRHQTCRAWVIEKETGERLDGPTVSIQMAIDEGWLTKNGSKWQTMPEIMLRYRAASFLGRLYAPELLMGMHSQEEAEDIAAGQAREVQGTRVSSMTVDDIRDRDPAAPAIIDTETGEITGQEGEESDAEVIDESHHSDDTLQEPAEKQIEPQADDLLADVSME